MGIMNIDLKKPVIILDAIIKGRFIETAKLALDTGASNVMIPWRIAKALGFNPEMSNEKTEVITASGTEFAPIIILDSVKVLGNEVKNVRAIVHNLPSKSYVDGLLGLSFLKNFNVKLNFREGFLEIE